MTASYTDAERAAAKRIGVTLDGPIPPARVVADLRRQARRYRESVRHAPTAELINRYRSIEVDLRLVANAVAREQRKAARS